MLATKKAPENEKNGYWMARAAIEKAAKEGNDEVLTALAKLYPEIFRDLVNFVQNQKKEIILP